MEEVDDMRHRAQPETDETEMLATVNSLLFDPLALLSDSLQCPDDEDIFADALPAPSAFGPDATQVIEDTFGHLFAHLHSDSELQQRRKDVPVAAERSYPHSRGSRGRAAIGGFQRIQRYSDAGRIDSCAGYAANRASFISRPQQEEQCLLPHMLCESPCEWPSPLAMHEEEAQEVCMCRLREEAMGEEGRLVSAMRALLPSVKACLLAQA